MINFILDVLALASSIGELTMHTRKARTAMWCALQMSGKDVPQLRMLSASNGVPQPSLGTTATSAEETPISTTTMSTTTATTPSTTDSRTDSSNDSNNNTTKSSA